MSSRLSKTLAFLIGGVIGVAVIRAFFLDTIEELGWRMFWRALGEGGSMDLGRVLNSSTFTKCMLGFLAGGGAGYAAVRLPVR
jgi:hypothetical protein